MSFSLDSILLWGFIATMALTLVQSLGRALHLTRMSIPFMLGTIATGHPDRSQVAGFSFHFMFGWFFSFLYALVFEALQKSSWWIGILLGTFHGLFALGVLIPLLPSIHPRMAGTYQQPEVTALLEPPGFFALNYGMRTPLVAFIAHLVYGMILGTFYEFGPT